MDGKRPSGLHGAGQSRAADVGQLETQSIALADNDRSEIEVGWVEGQQGRRIGNDNVVGAQQNIGAHRPADPQTDRISGRSEVSVVQGRRGLRPYHISGRAIAKIPETVGNGAGGVVGKCDGERPCAVGGRAEKACQRHLRAETGKGIGAGAAVAGENNDVAEAGGAGRAEGDHHLTGLAGSQVEGSTVLDSKGQEGCYGSGQGQAADVDKLEALGAGLADNHRSEVQMGRTEGELWRQIGYDDVIGAGQEIYSARTTHSETDRIRSGGVIGVKEIGRGYICLRAIAESPEAVGDYAQGVVPEGYG